MVDAVDRENPICHVLSLITIFINWLIKITFWAVTSNAEHKGTDFKFFMLMDRTIDE
jgi:hypothetical protein